MPMVDKLDALAFSMFHQPGVHALLIGSGASRTAHVPTGWQITLDLARRLAASMGEDCGPHPDRWYESRFGARLDYSDLLAELADTPAGRQAILRGYIEPGPGDLAKGWKKPNPAHMAMAWLMAHGYVRVAVTTNFDRLLENALKDGFGIVPTVLGSVDQIAGAPPLIHTRHCVVKVHGDYLDTRIRNTRAELDAYPPELDALLGRVFDDFGMVVCGWSAAGDAALKRALLSARRYYPAVWAGVEEPAGETRELVDALGAGTIRIADADTFFTRLRDKVAALEGTRAGTGKS